MIIVMFVSTYDWFHDSRAASALLTSYEIEQYRIKLGALNDYKGRHDGLIHSILHV